MNIGLAASFLGACAVAVAAITQAACAQGALGLHEVRVVIPISGNNQSQPRTGTSPAGGMAAFDPLSVKVTDDAGKAIPNVAVTWTCVMSGNMKCQVVPEPLNTTTTTTNAQGIATLNAIQGQSVYAYYADGPFTVTATYKAAVATFAMKVAPLTYTSKIVSGDNQIKPVVPTARPNGRLFDEATFTPLDVVFTDSAGRPAAGMRVTWTCNGAAGACNLAEGGSNSVETTTDAQGHAMLNQMFGNAARYNQAGAFTITTQGTGLGLTPLTFHLRATVAPAKI